MSAYLVTGCAGFIGSKVCEMLLAEGHSVVGIDNLNDYYDVRLKHYRLGRLLGRIGQDPSRISDELRALSSELEASSSRSTKSSELKAQSSKLAALDPQLTAQSSPITAQSSKLTAQGFSYQLIDIEDLTALEALFAAQSFDAVINLAARAGVRYSVDHPHVYLRTNAQGTLNLLDCQRRFGVRKLVLASSSSLYAGCPLPFTEDQPVNTPQSPYAASKKAAEMMAYTYSAMHGLDVTVLRYFTVFGPAGRPDMAPYRFVKWIAEGTPIQLYGDGTQTRDFTYIDDIARGTVAALRAAASSSELLASSPGTMASSSELLASSPEPSRKKAPSSPLRPAGPQGASAGQAPLKANPSETKNQSSELTAQSSELPASGSFEIINLGGGNTPVSLNTVIGWIERELGKTAVIEHLAPQAVDLAETGADISKAKRLLNWQPEISPEEGFRRTAEWYRQNAEWLKDISV